MQDGTYLCCIYRLRIRVLSTSDKPLQYGRQLFSEYVSSGARRRTGMPG